MPCGRHQILSDNLVEGLALKQMLSQMLKSDKRRLVGDA